MDKYFCRGCLSKWHAQEIMETCSGCLAHKRMGWTPQQLIDVYGPILETCEKAFFPRLKRPPLARQALPRHVDVSSARAWLETSDLLPGFRTQQRENVDVFESSPTRHHWNRLDPETQIHMLHLKYT